MPALHSPLVSVLIPAYNAAEHLSSTLRSVQEQTLRELEVIVVDDGSTDQTLAIAQAAALRDPRVRVIRQTNAGVGAARNAGLRLARGKYIAPFDADDLWSPHKIERQIARLEKTGSDTRLVYCWSRNIDRHGRVISWGHPYRIEGHVGAAMLLGNFVGSASVPLFRASALAAVGPYLTRHEQNGAQGCEDWDLNIRIAEKFRICCVPEYLVSYRQTHRSMSLNARSMARSYETAMRRAHRRQPDLPLFVRVWSASRFYSYLLSKCNGWSDYPGALFCFARALRSDPACLLDFRQQRIALLSLAHLITQGRFRRHRAPPAVTEGGDPDFAAAPAPALSPSSLFGAIQNRRLHIALRTLPLKRRLPVKARGAYGCY
jgi:glycosyltransferase involved in cell wall biosynthesis